MLGVITFIEPIAVFERLYIPNLTKQVFTLETLDEQILYLETRNAKVKLLENIDVNSIVEVEFTFEGSEKNNKRYNNLIVQKITKL